MSFLKNLRSSVSRKNSIRSKNVDSASDIKLFSKKNKNKKSKNLKDITTVNNENCIVNEQSEAEGLLRSGTYTIIDENGKVLIRQGTKSPSPVPVPTPVSVPLPVPVAEKRSGMFSKFGTFTRKKKNSSSKQDIEPKYDDNSDLYKDKQYLSEVSVTYPSSDPFNVFYQPTAVYTKKYSEQDPIEYGTYRKSKLPNTIKEQLENLHLDSVGLVDETQNDSDKFKTVTLKSFRKSFRDRFLTQQKDVPYNPSWFIEVEKSKTDDDTAEDEDERRRRQLLVFENDNYRPTARSPVRNTERSPTRIKTPKPEKSPTRKSSIKSSMSFNLKSQSPLRSSLKKSKHNKSPSGQKKEVSIEEFPEQNSPILTKPTVTVKRNETFKIERESPEPSIRIEIKNSISPNEPGRIVPVGVAKPMPSPISIKSYETDERTKSPDRNARDRRIESTSSGNKNYHTSIRINSPTSGEYYGTAKSRHHERSDVYSTSKSQQNTRPNTSSRNGRASKPIVDNYSPLTSYGLLSKMKSRSNARTGTTATTTTTTTGGYYPLRDSTKSFSSKPSDARYPSPSASAKRSNQSNSISSKKQKTSIYFGDNSVCKDTSSNQLSGSTKKRLRIKMPWK